MIALSTDPAPTAGRRSDFEEIEHEPTRTPASPGNDHAPGFAEPWGLFLERPSRDRESRGSDAPSTTINGAVSMPDGAAIGGVAFGSHHHTGVRAGSDTSGGTSDGLQDKALPPLIK